MRSHHKGHYQILNGSDKEPGGVRRGRKRKPKKEKPSLLKRALEKAKDIAKDAIEEAAKDAAKALKKRLAGEVKEGGTKSHHAGRYPIVNGSDKEPGGVRRGPKLATSQNEKLNQKRQHWRQAKRTARGK